MTNKETIISLEGRENLVDGIIKEYPDILNDPDSYKLHIKMTAEIAQELVEKAIYNNLWMEELLRPKEVIAAAGLHDVGRPLMGQYPKKGQLFHELVGAEWIRDNGEENGVAHTQDTVDRIAKMVRQHGFLHERWMLSDDESFKGMFEIFDPKSLLPSSWQSVFVTCADDLNDKGIRVDSLEEKYGLQATRYSERPEYKDGFTLPSIDDGKPRIIALYKDVSALIDGELNREQATKMYDFL